MAEPTSIESTAASVRSGERAATDVVGAALDRVESGDGDIASFRETCRDEALAAAARIDAIVAGGGDPGPLAGAPIAIKDNIAADFGVTACGSRMLADYRSPYSATAVEKLVAAGAVVIGKTNCDEFAMGSSTEHCAFGPTRNPWDTRRVPGGSSGGSAAAVAAGMVPGALGSDTGGSIRQPAALCGVVGVKPTYGRVSRYGLVAYGSSLDQVGPFATTVRDAALLLNAIAGPDPRDSTCAELPAADFAARLEEPIDGLRIGVVETQLGDGNDDAVNAAVREAIETYRRLGAEIVDVELPLTDYGIATYYVIAPAEASSNLARYDGVRYGHRATLAPGEDLEDLYAKSRAEGFGPEVQRRIMLGTYVLSAGYYDAFYKRALQVRRLISREYEAAFARCHALIGPTTPGPAFEIGAKTDPLTMYLCDVYTTNTNIAGICGMSLPAGFAEVDGATLPIGLQIQCRAFDEETMLRVGRQFEANTDFHTRRPCTERQTTRRP